MGRARDTPRQPRGCNWLVRLASLLGVGFVGRPAVRMEGQDFRLDFQRYGSLYFTITGFHMAHVVVGLVILLAATCLVVFGYFGPIRSSPVSIGAIYWHFVDAVWLTVFFTFYITPRLGLIWHAQT